MPTRDRPHFVEQAIKYFIRQTYADKQLIIVDDGLNDVAALVPQSPDIEYIRLDERHSEGAKRNLAIERCRANWIAHWNDDDWIAPHRLGRQMALIMENEAKFACAADVMYYQVYAGKAWRARRPERGNSSSGTWLYEKDLWRKYRFPEGDGESVVSWMSNLHESSRVSEPQADWYVAVVHNCNSRGYNFADTCWEAASLPIVVSLLSQDLSFYDNLRRTRHRSRYP